MSTIDGAEAPGWSAVRTTAADEEVERFHVGRVHRCPRLLRPFNEIGVLSGPDIHVALRLARLGGDARDAVVLGAALAVRAPRLGHVCTDLRTITATVAVDAELPVDLSALPWPEPDEWVSQLAASPLVAVGEGQPGDRPLRLVGSRLYLDRYWREERQVAADLVARAQAGAAGVAADHLAEGLARLFPPQRPVGGDGLAPDHQRLAAATAVLRRFAVVAGGPGTGKTTTVARILALLHEQAAVTGAPAPLVALAAPTGKAAARLEEAVHHEAGAIAVSDAVAGHLLGLQASTLHRLLGWRPGNRSRFRHDRANRLPHDVVIVDEASMVSLSLMARLVEAVRPAARLVLVGDPEQLASVEAGAVMGDVVGPAAGALLLRQPARAALEQATGQEVPAGEPPAGAVVGDGIIVLRRVHRFGGGIAALAEAIRAGDGDAAVRTLVAGGEGGDVHWVDADVAAAGHAGDLSTVRQAAVAAGRRVIEEARAGRAVEAICALGQFRLLCAHRRGPYGVETWMAQAERWLAEEVGGFGPSGPGGPGGSGQWYAGRPLLITENDYGLRLYNGDTGVVVAAGAGRLHAVFERRGELLRFSPSRLSAVDTVHAMTIHKSQGSQFDQVAVVLPDPASRILTRELLYTAATRARRRLVVVATEESVRAAVGRPVARASGLRALLWSGG
ncbi:MAG: exodeoxyribonuclease V subunit alpha [Actinobacteria bacterium]|nr:exodeoxyribonuclease V subunit alpha [Actinomycetota bacterium]